MTARLTAAENETPTSESAGGGLVFHEMRGWGSAYPLRYAAAMGNYHPELPGTAAELEALIDERLSRDRLSRFIQPDSSETLRILPPRPSGAEVITRDGVVDSIRDILGNLAAPAPAPEVAQEQSE